MTPPRPIGYWLKLVDHLIDERFEETLEEHGVTRRQWQLLNVLAHEDATLEQLNADIAPFLAQDDTESSASHLSELVESSWVVETAGSYSMTELGRSTFSRLAEVVQRNRDAAADGIDPDDYASTLEVLERMARNLGWSG